MEHLEQRARDLAASLEQRARDIAAWGKPPWWQFWRRRQTPQSAREAILQALTGEHEPIEVIVRQVHDFRSRDR